MFSGVVFKQLHAMQPGKSDDRPEAGLNDARTRPDAGAEKGGSQLGRAVRQAIPDRADESTGL